LKLTALKTQHTTALEIIFSQNQLHGVAMPTFTCLKSLLPIAKLWGETASMSRMLSDFNIF
jgi:hypothetical protein